MIKEFEPIVQGIIDLVGEWEPKLLKLPNDVITCLLYTSDAADE